MEMSFGESQLGKGRPGWHIECSVMSTKYLGETFDIHAGAEDLIFPHHTNEIAQAEAVSSKKFVNFWIHGAFLSLDKEKMAKSEGNVITLRDVIDKGFNPLAFRYLTLTAHYRSVLNFSWDSLASAQSALNNLQQAVAGLPDGGDICEDCSQQFLGFVNNDLDMPKALALVWQLVKDNKVAGQDKKTTLIKFDQVLGLRLDKVRKEKIPDEIKKLADQREAARKDKKWQEADKIRKEIEGKGWQIEDSADGAKIKKK